MFPRAEELRKQKDQQDMNAVLMCQMSKVYDALSFHVNERDVIVGDEGQELMDLFSYFMISDHSISLAELDDQIIKSPRRDHKRVQRYKIPDEIADVTLATEDDEDFQIDNIRTQGRFSNSVRRLNFEDSLQ